MTQLLNLPKTLDERVAHLEVRDKAIDALLDSTDAVLSKQGCMVSMVGNYVFDESPEGPMQRLRHLEEVSARVGPYLSALCALVADQGSLVKLLWEKVTGEPFEREPA